MTTMTKATRAAMLALSLACAALVIALLVTVAWGLDAVRAYRIAERRRIHAFRLAELSSERERFAVAIRDEALDQLRVIHADLHRAARRAA